MNAKDREAIEGLLSAATQGNYLYGVTPTHSYDEHLAWFKKVLDQSPDQSKGLWLVMVNDDETGETQRTIAITGNGPTSEANAIMLHSAPYTIRYLLQEHDHLTQQVKELLAQVERFYHTLEDTIKENQTKVREAYNAGREDGYKAAIEESKEIVSEEVSSK
jgi:hypothetical protein